MFEISDKITNVLLEITHFLDKMSVCAWKRARKSIPSLPLNSREGAVNFVIKFVGGRAMYMVDA